MWFVTEARHHRCAHQCQHRRCQHHGAPVPVTASGAYCVWEGSANGQHAKQPPKCLARALRRPTDHQFHAQGVNAGEGNAGEKAVENRICKSACNQCKCRVGRGAEAGAHSDNTACGKPVGDAGQREPQCSCNKTQLYGIGQQADAGAGQSPVACQSLCQYIHTEPQ